MSCFIKIDDDENYKLSENESSSIPKGDYIFKRQYSSDENDMIILTDKSNVAKSFTIIKNLNEALYAKVEKKISDRIENNTSCFITRGEGGVKTKVKENAKNASCSPSSHQQKQKIKSIFL